MRDKVREFELDFDIKQLKWELANLRDAQENTFRWAITALVCSLISISMLIVGRLLAGRF